MTTPEERAKQLAHDYFVMGETPYAQDDLEEVAERHIRSAERAAREGMRERAAAVLDKEAADCEELAQREWDKGEARNDDWIERLHEQRDLCRAQAAAIRALPTEGDDG